MKPRPSLQNALYMEGINYNASKTGEFTNRSLAKSVYSNLGGFNTTKNKDLKLSVADG